jgi:LCP family protein required for cell wall assembly
MVGMDSRTDAQGNPLSKEQLAMLSAGVSDGELNTDTLIMVRIPNDGGPAVGVSFPRDSYVDIANGYGKHKINSAYVRANNDAMNKLRGEGVSNQAELQVKSNQEGARNLIATIQDLTGVTIEHYAEVNLLGFYDITNAIGGIDVCLNAPVKDKYSGANFPAGPQTLAGQQALAFVRQRHGLPNGDLDRIVRQQVFMSGMAKKVLSGDMLAPGSDTLDNLQAAIQKSVVLDRDWNVLQFAQQMMTITGGKVGFQTIPHGTIDLKTRSDGSAIEIDPDAVREFVQGLVTPKDKGKDKEGGSPSESADDDASKNANVTVNVRNATGKGGLAGGVAETLAGKGFTKGDVGNAAARDTTVVRHATGEADNGNRVATALGGDLQVEEDSNLPPGTVTVLLGADYDGPGSSGSDSAESDGDRLAGKPVLNLAGTHPAQAQPPNPGPNGCVN